LAAKLDFPTPPFPLRGQDLLDRQVQPGPEVGKLLKQLEDWWLDNDLKPDRNATLEELDKRLANP
jgi:poly(A) polymerase